MQIPRTIFTALTFCFVLAFAGAATAKDADLLRSWKDGKTKQSIVAFVDKVTKPGSPDYVAPAERVATFDNDGTLWAEQPLYAQLFFAIERVKVLAPQHPEWKTQEPFASLLKGDMHSALAGGEKAIIEIVMASHAGMSTDEFETIVKQWAATAKNPKLNQLFTACVYQPMLEVLNYLRVNGFKTYIVSGGGIEFMRPWAEKVYGVPPEQVVGSSIKTEFQMVNGKAVLIRQPAIDFIDDGPGKPVGINAHIGRRPIIAFGNSNGDQQMLEYTQGGNGARLMLLVHHDDAVREFAYGADSKIGTFSDALMTEANTHGWTVISMKDDWKTIFPFQK